MANPYGDIELDARGMRALAHPVRVAILSQLQQHGASTATGLSPQVGASPSVTSWHLRHLAEHGLVRDAAAQGSGRERWWEASARGFRCAAGEGAGDAAYRALSDVIEQVEGDLPERWRVETEPLLEAEWRRLAGRANTQILVTIEELAAIEDAIEALLAPYVLRKDASPSEQPPDARRVRVLRYTLPGLAPGQGPDRPA